MGKLALAYPQLCLIVDPARPNLDSTVELALAAGVNMIQLRGHHSPCSTLHFVEVAQALRQRCQAHQAALLVNDRLDIGLACGADGFQLGKHSFPLAVARGVVGAQYLLGASVHSLAEARAAVADGADFLLAGTIFPSASHPGGTVQGPALLSALKQEMAACPVLAVGGITPTNVRQVMEAGADGIAVISAIFDAPDSAQVVHALRHALLEKEKLKYG